MKLNGNNFRELIFDSFVSRQKLDKNLLKRNVDEQIYTDFHHGRSIKYEDHIIRIDTPLTPLKRGIASLILKKI